MESSQWENIATGTDYPSGMIELTPGFVGVRVARS
jgi:hypothetical protein